MSKLVCSTRPFLERDFAVERGGNAEVGPALELRLNRVGIDDCAAIHRTNHTPDANAAVLRDLDCEPARGADADRRVKPLIQFAVEGSLLHAE